MNPLPQHEEAVFKEFDAGEHPDGDHRQDHGAMLVPETAGAIAACHPFDRGQIFSANASAKAAESWFLISRLSRSFSGSNCRTLMGQT
jgi:hypothetical protein